MNKIEGNWTKSEMMFLTLILLLIVFGIAAFILIKAFPTVYSEVFNVPMNLEGWY